MYLVELIPTPDTQPGILDQLESFATTMLGKGVVRALDTPNFVANRVGIAGMLAAMIEADKFGLSYDVVDDLTGKKLGRASSATFRTADVVGLDTMAHVIRTMQEQLPNDPFHACYATPPVLAQLLAKGQLGQKSGAGFFRKAGKDILRLDPATGNYVEGGAKADDIIGRILKKPAPERLRLLRESGNPQAQFLWALLRDNFHYVAVHLADIADTAREIDLAMRWGFGQQQGPFELWQQAGWGQVAHWIQEDIAAGKTLCAAPLPEWVFQGPVAEHGGVHGPLGSWSAYQGCFKPRASLPVYERQPFPETLVGVPGTPALDSGTEYARHEDIRIWSLDGEVLIASITSKLHLISTQVIDGLNQAIDLAESHFKGLVIWSPDDVFSAGANLEALMPVFMAQGPKGIEPEEKKLQDLVLRMRYAQVPVVAALRGLTLGGGCEMAVHCAARVAHLETYMGLVEVGVGLIPGGGGLCYVARHAAEMAEQACPGQSVDLLPFVKEAITHAATARVSTSALEARHMGFLLTSDVVVPNKDELLHVASTHTKALYNSGYRPPVPRLFPVLGRHGLATIRGQLLNMREGGFISAYDEHLASLIAQVVCGGDVEPGTLVSESYLMALERQHFCALLSQAKTQERIMGMLQTGKPVRN